MESKDVQQGNAQSGKKHKLREAWISQPSKKSKSTSSEESTVPQSNQQPAISPATTATQIRTKRNTATVRATKSGSNRREKKCENCEGCLREDCGACQSCRINKQFQGNLNIGRALCLKKTCLNPIPINYEALRKETVGKPDGKLINSLMTEQIDKANPFKIIDGVLYDYRCFFCKKLPRATTANRSELYRHYSMEHYSEELKNEFGYHSDCPRCPTKNLSGKRFLDHLGQVHNEVDKYLPQEARIPLKLKTPKVPRKSKVVSEFIFPDIPVCWDSNSNIVQRDYLPSVDEEGVVVPDLVYMEKKETPLHPEVVRALKKYPNALGACGMCYNENQFQTLQDLFSHLLDDHCLELESADIVDTLISEKIITVRENSARAKEVVYGLENVGGIEEAVADDHHHSVLDSGENHEAISKENAPESPAFAPESDISSINAEKICQSTTKDVDEMDIINEQLGVQSKDIIESGEEFPTIKPPAEQDLIKSNQDEAPTPCPWLKKTPTKDIEKENIEPHL